MTSRSCSHRIIFRLRAIVSKYDFLGDEIWFEEFKGDEKVGTLAEIEIEIPSKQVIFKL